MAQVLWAEDCEGDRHLIRSVLEMLPGAPAVHFVADGLPLLEAAARSRPRLVVLDIVMPAMGGVEALLRLRRDRSMGNVPVVMFTTSDAPRERQLCLGLGADDYVPKPVVYADFAEAVRRVLSSGRYRARRRPMAA